MNTKRIVAGALIAGAAIGAFAVEATTPATASASPTVRAGASTHFGEQSERRIIRGALPSDLGLPEWRRYRLAKPSDTDLPEGTQGKTGIPFDMSDNVPSGQTGALFAPPVPQGRTSGR